MADSTADLSPELVEKYKIVVVPLHVVFTKENIDYLDGKTIDPETIYQKVKKYNQTPKTGAININEFINYFTKYIEEGDDILFTGIGSGFSSTINNAFVASKNFPENRIFILDSQNLSTGTGLLVLKMAEYRSQGLSASEIVEKVKPLVPFVNSKFVIDTLEYLYKGGRCSSLARFTSMVVPLHPVIAVKNNAMGIRKITLGRYRVGVKYQLDLFKKDLPEMDTSHVFVTDSGHMDGEDEFILNELKKYIPESHIHHTHAGCVVSSHCGPKTIGILYIKKKVD